MELARLTQQSSENLLKRQLEAEMDPNREALLRHDTFTSLVYAQARHNTLIELAEIVELADDDEATPWNPTSRIH